VPRPPARGRGTLALAHDMPPAAPLLGTGNPKGATIFSKGHTSWDTPLHLYISVMICRIQIVLSFVSLSILICH
jgi:hypothetical protein